MKAVNRDRERRFQKKKISKALLAAGIAADDAMIEAIMPLKHTVIRHIGGAFVTDHSQPLCRSARDDLARRAVAAYLKHTGRDQLYRATGHLPGRLGSSLPRSRISGGWPVPDEDDWERISNCLRALACNPQNNVDDVISGIILYRMHLRLRMQEKATGLA